MPRLKIAYLILLVAFLGFCDAAYLTIQHFRGIPPNCSIIVGCDIVAKSSFSVVYSIPVALLGVIYYAIIIFLSVHYLESKNLNVFKYLVPFTAAGLVVSLWFTFLQFFVIKALCIWCLGSALSSATLFILGLITAKIINDRPYLRLLNALRNFFK